MKTYKYKSYQQYKKVQNDANARKEWWVWVSKETIDEVCRLYGPAKNILCHGTRNGAEQKYFYENNPGSYVIGSEIAESAIKYERTVKWDFGQYNPKWEGKFDIVYSNSFDHAYNPEECIQIWRDQLNENGEMYIEWTTEEKQVKVSDPVGGTLDDLKQLLERHDLGVIGSFESIANLKSKDKTTILRCKKK